jgi:hypothetical protein
MSDKRVVEIDEDAIGKSSCDALAPGEKCVALNQCREVLPEPGLSSNDISALEVKSCDAGHRIHRDGLVWLEAMDLLDRRACRAKTKEGK